MSLRQNINITHNRDGASAEAKQLMAEVAKKQEELKKKVIVLNQEAEKFSKEFGEACDLRSQFAKRVRDRNLFAKSILVRIIEENKEAPDKNVLASYIDSLQTSAQQITKEIKEENEAQKKLLDKLDEVEAININVKKYTDNLPSGSDMYNKYMEVYNNEVLVFNELCSGFESIRPHKIATDQLCKLAQEKILEETEGLAKVQKEEKTKDSPLGSKSNTPPSKSEVLASSGDEVASVASDLSDISLSSSRRDSSDEEKDKTSKDSPESPKSRLFSSAMVGSLLPSTPVTQPRPLSRSKADLKEPSVVGQRSQVPQVPSAAVSKTSTPQQNKGLLARLGFNKDKSTTQSPQPPVTGSRASVTPGVTLQRNGLTTVR